MFFDVTVKSTAAASHLHDDLRLFRFFRIGSAPRFTSCPYGTEHFGADLFLFHVFSRTCAGKKHRNPPIVCKQTVKPARRPGPDAGCIAATALLGRAASAAWGAGSPSFGRPKPIRSKGPPTKALLLWGNQNPAKRFCGSIQKAIASS